MGYDSLFHFESGVSENTFYLACCIGNDRFPSLCDGQSLNSKKWRQDFRDLGGIFSSMSKVLHYLIVDGVETSNGPRSTDVTRLK